MLASRERKVLRAGIRTLRRALDLDGLAEVQTTAGFPAMEREATAEALAEDSAKEPEHTAVVKYDGDFDLAGLLLYINKIGAVGHSFSIWSVEVDGKRPTQDEEAFQESKHPRDPDGKFATGSGGGKSAGGLSTYYAKKYSPSTSLEHLTKQVNNALTLNSASGEYRNVIKMFLSEADKFNAPATLKQALKDKIVSSLKKQQENLQALGKTDKAQSIEKKLKKWGVAPSSAPVPPASQPTSTISKEDLAKAKGTLPFPNSSIPGANEAIQAFNAKYSGKQLTSTPELEQKVLAFKQMQQKVAEATEAHQKVQAEAQKKQAEVHSAEVKQAMKDLGIGEEQAEAFTALAHMIGADKHGSLVNSFKSYEKNAKSYGYPLSGFETALISNYSNGGYRKINHDLRSGAWTPKQHVYVKMVNSALSKMPRYEGECHRIADIGKEQQDFYRNSVGKIVEERSFTSTTSNPGKFLSGGTMFKIKATGKRAASIKKLSNYPGEDEVLFSARTAFKITGTSQKGGQLVVHMEEWD